MTDDEVMQWLSYMGPTFRSEHRLWDMALCLSQDDDDVSGFSQAPLILDALRSLAETRRALASIEFGGLSREEGWCPFCHTGDKHQPSCIFSTMPRPKP